MELTIKSKRGIFVILYDEIDHELVSKNIWFMSSHENPYATRSRRGFGKWPKKEYLHRLILELSDPNTLCDHINRNPLDNRRSNLRIATKSQNNFNKQGYGTSKYRGVYFNKEKNKWQVSLMIDGKYKNVGRFEDEVLAAKQYDKYAKIHHGEFAFLNFNQNT